MVNKLKSKPKKQPKKKPNKKIVWTFTNKTQLTKSEFLNYIERKTWKTIRKYNMLPKSKQFKLKQSKDTNTQVLKHILNKKFPIKLISSTNKTTQKPNIQTQNLSQIAEQIMKNILKGKYKDKTLTPKNKPLYFISTKELELYAKLTNIKTTKIKPDKKIQKLFNKFLEKNPDLEHNIINAFLQINK